MVSSSLNWDRSENLLEPDVRALAHARNDRFAHQSSTRSLAAKHSKEGTMKDGTVIAPGFACRNYVHKSSGPLSTCSKTCEICSRHFRPLQWQMDIPVLRYTRQHDDTSATTVIRNAVDATLRDLNEARAFVKKFGDTLANRWQRRTATKRKAMIIEALPSMLRGRYDEVHRDKMAGVDLSSLKTGLLLPWLNVESLGDDASNFLSLLNHHTNSCLSDWNQFIGSQMQGDFAQGLLQAEYNPHCVVMQGADSDIGKLVHWEKSAAHRSIIVGFPCAKLIIEAHEILARFLVKIVRALLGGKVDDCLQGSDKWNTLARTDFLDLQPPKLRAIGHAPGYRAPPSRLIAMLERTVVSIQTRLAAAESFCWKFHTDPHAVRQALKLSAATRFHKSAGEVDLHTGLLTLMLDTCSRPLQLRVVLEEAEASLKLCKQTLPEFGTHEGIQSLCAKTLHILYTCARLSYEGKLKLARSLATRLGIFDAHVRYDPSTETIRVTPESDSDALCRLFRRICFAEDCEASDPSTVFHKIAHYFEQATGKDRDRCNEMFIHQLHDLAALSEVITGFRLLQPSLGLLSDTVHLGPNLQMLDRRDSHRYMTFFAAFYQSAYHQYADKMWPFIELIMAIPDKSGGKPNRKNLEALRECHDALDAFWTAMEYFRAEEASVILSAVVRPLDVPHEETCVYSAMGLTGYPAERVRIREELEVEIEKHEAPKPRQDSALALPLMQPRPPLSSQPLLGNPSPQPKPKGSSPKPSPPKVKLKTRPTNPAPLPPPAPPRPPTPPPPLPPILLSTSSHRLLTEIFTNAGKKTLSTIRFLELINAIADGGIEVTQGTGGSSVVLRGFNPEGTRMGGRMTVHKPHPKDVVNPIMAGDVAELLQERFGWEVGRFVVRKRGGGRQG